MKRQRSEDGGTPRRKSARLSSLAKSSNLEKLETSEDIGNGMTLGGLRRVCEAYNAFLPYGKDSSVGSRVRTRVDAVTKALRAAEDVIRKAYLDIDKKTAELDSRVHAYIESAVSAPGDYAKGNLLACSAHDLQHALQHIFVEDAERFAEYVRACLKPALRMDRVSDEQPRYHSPEKSNPFISKLFRLLQTMFHQDLSIPTFHAMVYAKTVFRGKLQRVDTGEQETAHRCLDQAIRAFVGDVERPECVDEPNADDHRNHNCTVGVTGSVWYQGSSDWEGIKYWDYASAVRELRVALKKHDSLCRTKEYDNGYGYGGDDGYRNNHRTPRCFHENSFDMIEWLQKKAWGEIRSNLLRLVGTRLPVELADSIFEYALEAEGVPAQPGLKEKYRPEIPAPQRRRGRRACVQSRRKLEYTCAKTRKSSHPPYDLYPSSESDSEAEDTVVGAV
ncbi:hypothetical protein LTR56_004606 [Elasticomyces elasticus]|nr:hypothetical protein LTR56_004606 [Elasticomyces elasticus]